MCDCDEADPWTCTCGRAACNDVASIYRIDFLPRGAAIITIIFRITGASGRFDFFFAISFYYRGGRCSRVSDIVGLWVWMTTYGEGLTRLD